MPYKDPARRRAYKRAWDRAHGRTVSRNPRVSKVSVRSPPTPTPVRTPNPETRIPNPVYLPKPAAARPLPAPVPAPKSATDHLLDIGRAFVDSVADHISDTSIERSGQNLIERSRAQKAARESQRLREATRPVPPSKSPSEAVPDPVESEGGEAGEVGEVVEVAE